MRRLSLLGKFALLSAACMAVLGLALARSETVLIRNRALATAQSSAQLLAHVGLQSHLVPSDVENGLSPGKLVLLDDAYHTALASGSIARIKIWSPRGAVVYSDDHALIGRTFPLSSDLREALEGEASADVSDLASEENVDERAFGKLFEVYLPLRFAGQRHPAGAFELYVPYAPIAAVIATDTHKLYLITVAGLLLLYLVLYRIVARASRRLREDAGDLTRKAAENEYLARHDSLTGLPNRAMFRDVAERTIAEGAERGDASRSAEAGEPHTGVAVLIMDLNRFKELNDTLGHGQGDEVLREVGPRLEEAVDGADIIARLGGDEFGILISGADAPAVEGIAEGIIRALRPPFHVSGFDIEVSTSVGGAMYPEHGTDVDSLMRRADVAMYAAKGAQSGFEFYAAEKDEYTTARLTLATELRQAIHDDELILYYQPILDLRTGAVVRAEALARWRHPIRGTLMPTDFIPLAEQTGLIRELFHEVFQEALAQCKKWREIGLTMPVSVNVSARNLLDSELPGFVYGVMERYGIQPGLVTLEVTESAMMEQPARAEAILSRLRAGGLHLAIDDFGIGYSSLSYLQRLAVDELKIDRSFVTQLEESQGDAVIVQSTVSLAINLGLRVVAEGVESPEALELLRSLGCDQAQGFHIARPMPADQFTTWLEEWSRAA